MFVTWCHGHALSTGNWIIPVRETPAGSEPALAHVPNTAAWVFFVLSHLSLRCWATGTAEGTFFSIYQEEVLCSANVNPRLKQKRDKQEMKLICLMELKG